MTNLLIIDTETTGLHDGAKCCEIAASLYHVNDGINNFDLNSNDSYLFDNCVSGVVASVSFLLPVYDNIAFNVNKIDPGLTQQSKLVFSPGIEYFLQLCVNADHYVAFNAYFDKNVLLKAFDEKYFSKDDPWLCAMNDFQWQIEKNKSGKFRLVDLALQLGIGVSNIHRAADDVRLLVECFNRVRDLPKMVEQALKRAKSPEMTIKADVSYENRKSASDSGFYWKFEIKSWIKEVKECDFSDSDYKFPVSIISV
jgi:DNA polymerase-3 subunit epsilon